MISGVREAGASLAVAGRAAFAALFGRCSATGGGGGCTTLSGGGGAPGGGGGGAGSGCTTPGGTGGGNGGAGCIRTGGGSGGALVSAFRKLWPHFGQNLAAGAQVFCIVDSARRQWPPAQQQSAGYRSPGRTLQWAHSRRHIWYKPCPTRLFCLVIRRTALKASWLEIDLPGQVPTREFCPADSFAKAECMLICRKWHPRAEHPASGFAAQKAAIN